MARREWRGDGATPSSRGHTQVCPAPKPINEFAEALAAAARADEGEEGANKAVDAFEPVWKSTSESGYHVPLIHSTEWSEQHLTPTARDPELKGA